MHNEEKGGAPMTENQFYSVILKMSIGNLSFTATIGDGFLKSYPLELAHSTEKNTHFHPLYEFFFVTDEPLILECEDKEYSFQNCAFLIPPFVQHTVKRRTNAYCFLVEYKSKPVTDDNAYTDISSLFAKPLTPLKVDHFSFECLSSLTSAHNLSQFLAEERAKALLKLIFISLYENNVSDISAQKSTAINDYCIVIDYFIYQHYTENITLSTIAEALHLSVKQTSRIIRKRYHASLSDLLNEKRLNVAAHLLESSDQPITQIASRLFYRSENYFFRLFKSKYGLSPLAYRKKHREHIDI